MAKIQVQEIRGSIQGCCLLMVMATFSVWPVMSLAMDADDYLREAKTYLEHGQNTHAVIQLKNALLLDQNNIEARLLLGEAYLDQEDILSAEKELNRARELGAGREQVKRPWRFMIISTNIGIHPSTMRKNGCRLPGLLE